MAETFYDCNPLGTYTQSSAMEACTAYANATGGSVANCIDCNPGMAICFTSGGFCSGYAWQYAGTNLGKVLSCLGTVLTSWN